MSGPKKYTKIPVTVEAMQWTHDVPMKHLQQFTNHLVRLNDVGDEFYVYDRLHDTWVQFDWDDWIVKGVEGEFYPVKNSVFKETYREKGKRGVDVEPDPHGPAVIYTPPPAPGAAAIAQVREAVQKARGR